MKPNAFACGLLLWCISVAAQTTQPAWQSIDGTWDGGSTAPIWKLMVWPGKDLLIASTRSNGLWSSADGGESWKRMGEPGKTPPNAGQAVTFVFDPKDDQTMWTAGMYGYGVWKTSDGGKTFTQLIKDKTHVDGISVDFTDPQRKTILIGLHEQEQSIHRSTDGGATWEKIGDKVPAGTAFTSDPIILDSKNYHTPSAGYKKDEKGGIYRSEDGGQTWTSVSKEGASGNCLITSKGEIYWPRLWDQAIIKSTDQGKTWSRMPGQARGILVEIQNGWLVGLGGKDRTQLFISKD